MTEHFQVYTDGSCIGNNVKAARSAGGWAAIILSKEHSEIQMSGGSSDTTNNVMEMVAVIKALEFLRNFKDCTVEVLTDSMYVIKGCTEWKYGWMARNWRKTDGSPVLNKELWCALFELVVTLNVKFTKVKGHSGNKYNDMCDSLACAQSKRFSEKN